MQLLVIQFKHVKLLDCNLYYQHLYLKYLSNLARYWLQAAWGWHDSVETCSSVIICEIIVHLSVIAQNNIRIFRLKITFFSLDGGFVVFTAANINIVVLWHRPRTSYRGVVTPPAHVFTYLSAFRRSLLPPSSDQSQVTKTIFFNLITDFGLLFFFIPPPTPPNPTFCTLCIWRFSQAP